jgi:transcriptional regulator with XRE-family HTH domain
MSIPTTRPTAALVIDARRALGLSRDKFAELLRSSKRTVARWEAGESTVYPQVLFELARHVHPSDAKLAEEIALAGGTTLQKLGIAPSLEAPPLPPHVLVDAIVCAAADALKAVPDTVRGAVLAAFKRARELRMTVEDVEKAMTKR